MDALLLFGIPFIIQLILIGVVLAKPVPAGLSSTFQRMRNLVIVIGLIPCSIFSLGTQLIYFFIYMGKLKAIESGTARAQAKLGGSPPSAGGGGNPFGGGSAPPPPPSNGNPFASGGDQTPSPAPNPFGESAGSSDPSSDNPFA